jgi:hypothetical protein
VSGIFFSIMTINLIRNAFCKSHTTEAQIITFRDTLQKKWSDGQVKKLMEGTRMLTAWPVPEWNGFQRLLILGIIPIATFWDVALVFWKRDD